MGNGEDRVGYADYEQPLSENRFFWLSWFFVALITGGLWLYHPTASVVIGLAAVFLVLLVSVRTRHIVAYLILYFMALWFFWEVVIGGLHLHKHSPSWFAKRNLQTIQLALERYATDHGELYPLHISALQDEKYLPKFPENEFRAQKSADLEFGSPEERDEYCLMKPITAGLDGNLGDNGTTDALGDFAYFPHTRVEASGQLQAASYDLCVFIAREHEYSKYYTGFDAYWLSSR